MSDGLDVVVAGSCNRGRVAVERQQIYMKCCTFTAKLEQVVLSRSDKVTNWYNTIHVKWSNSNKRQTRNSKISIIINAITGQTAELVK